MPIRTLNKYCFMTEWINSTLRKGGEVFLEEVAFELGLEV